MAPPTSSHLYWKPLRALGLLLDIPALVIIIVASRKVTDSTFGIIGIGLYFSIILNLIGFLPAVPDHELPTYYPIFGDIRDGLRIGFETLSTITLIAAAVLYSLLSSFKSIPLATIGAVVIFLILSAYHLAMAIADLVFTIRDRTKPTPVPRRRRPTR